MTRPLFSAAAGAFADVSAGAFVASFLGAMLMFAAPVTALGMVSPWAVRLSVRDVSEAGTVAGRLYALSTVGSIVGTFLPVLVLIPAIGTRRTLLAIAALLALVAAPVAARRLRPRRRPRRRWRWCRSARSSAGRRGPGALRGRVAVPVRRRCVRQPDGATVLHLNEGWALHSLLPARGVLTGGYWDAFLPLPLLTGRPAGRLAVLGNAGGTTATQYERAWPDAPIDGVEIDPLVIEVGRRYFGMTMPEPVRPSRRTRATGCAGTDERFDAIVVDAYRQPYIPFHLATREFFHLVRDRLAPGGRGGDQRRDAAATDDRGVSRIAETMRAVFPAVQAPGTPLQQRS